MYLYIHAGEREFLFDPDQPNQTCSDSREQVLVSGKLNISSEKVINSNNREQQ